MPKRKKFEEGYVVIFFALSVLVLFGFIGLAIDVTRHMVVRAEMQNSVDACAISAVSELNGLSDALTRAASVGAYVGGVRNKQKFQNEIASISTNDVKFSATLSGPFLEASSGNSSTSRFVRCQHSVYGLTNYFMSFLGFAPTDLTVSATSTTMPSMSTCALPMGIFSSNDADLNFGYSKGNDLKLSKALSEESDGFFTWADVSGNMGTTSLAPYTQAIIQYGKCDASTVNGRCIDIKTGAVTSLDDAWNSRYGLYKSGTAALTPSTATPDLSGYCYRAGDMSCANLSNAADDYRINRGNNRQAFQGSLPSYVPIPNVHNDFGASGRRLAVMPVISKSNSCGAGKRSLVGWACVFLMAPKTSSQYAEIEYQGNASDSNSICKTSGVPGGLANTGPLVPVIVQ
jgi:hypothetical protein